MASGSQPRVQGVSHRHHDAVWDNAPHLPLEDRLFLIGDPNEVRKVATHHREKFRSAGLQQMEDSELLTQAGLHPGSPRHSPPHDPQPETAPAAAPAGGHARGSSSSPLGSAPHQHQRQHHSHEDPYFQLASHVPQSLRFPKVEDGSDYVFGQAADSLDFASEEMDAE